MDMSGRRSHVLAMPSLTSKRSRASLRDAKSASTSKHTSSVHSFDSAVSEPPTPTWSIRGHGRYPSSNSSVASTPPCTDLPDLSGSSTRLSKLAEEPPEPEDDCVYVDGDDEDSAHGDNDQLWSCLCDAHPCAHTTGVQTVRSPVFELSDGVFAASGSAAASRSSSLRRTSPDESAHSIASKFTQRFPSLSRRWTQRKPTLSVATGYATPALVASSRSSSLSSGAVPPFGSHDELSDPFAPSPLDAVAPAQATAAMDIPSPGQPTDPIDRATMASTPLLPPLIDEAQPAETPLQSPLQSPTVADSCTSLPVVPSAATSPQLQGVKTPPLSSKPSLTSLRLARSGLMSPSDGPPLKKGEPSPYDPNDPWRIKLGHSDFSISPAPYLPEELTTESVADLFCDWERARHNFTKHQHRTGEHFGATSITYMLTEEKWSEIDTLWKQNYDFAVTELARSGKGVLPRTPEEPAPLMKIPSLDDPNAPGKFPTLGDEDIVGPMVRAAAPVLPSSPSRPRTLFKLLSNLIIPNSSTSIRPGPPFRRNP